MNTEILSLVVAALAVLISPIVTYRVNKKNLEFKFRTMLQESWIEKLESAAHDFLNASSKFIGKYKSNNYKVAYGSNERIKEIDQLLDDINSSFIKLDLHLDENKNYQKEIHSSASKLLELFWLKDKYEENHSEITKCYDEVVKNMKLIISDERKKISRTFR